MKRVLFIFAILVVSIFFIQSTGCTLIGLVAGLYSDASHLEHFDHTTYEIHNFETGTSMDVFLVNEDTVRGEFLRLDEMKGDEYAVKYERYRQMTANEIGLPALYDTICVNRDEGCDYVFLGFDYGCMKAKMTKYNRIAKIYLTNIDYISDSKNHHIDGEQLREIVLGGAMPLMSDLVLQKDSTEIKITAEDLVEGKITDSHYGWLIGLSAGLAADALLAFFVIIPSVDWTGMGGWGE